MAPVGIFGAIDYIGGGPGSLDKIDSTTGKVVKGTSYPLATDDKAVVFAYSYGRIDFYNYNAVSTVAEDTVNFTVIRPDDIDPANPGRWEMENRIGGWEPVQTAQISSGVVSLDGSGRYQIQVETGSADDLDQVTGLQKDHVVILVPDDAAKPITVKHGTYLKLQRGADFTLNNTRDKIILHCEGSDICSEITRTTVEA